jgi:hypothetical protein
MLEAMNLHFEAKGKTFTEADLKITLDLPQFFEFYKVINAKALSERIGMNQSLLAQYIKGIKKPSSNQTLKICLKQYYSMNYVKILIIIFFIIMILCYCKKHLF